MVNNLNTTYALAVATKRGRSFIESFLLLDTI